MYGRRFTEEQKKDMSLKNMGENNPNWKGGNIKYCSRIREMPEYFSWIIDVYDRDGKQCQICKTIKGSFNVDHIVPFSYIVRKNNLTTVLEAKECEELWDINNGRVLCVECHRKTDTYAGKASSYKE
ncbi:MAG: hypothetical protein Q8P20_11180 [bacterium]|nr:hypothetical protein [bacterium]